MLKLSNLPVRINFYSATTLLAMQSAVLATAIPSVRLSHAGRPYPIQTNEDRITGLHQRFLATLLALTATQCRQQPITTKSGVKHHLWTSYPRTLCPCSELYILGIKCNKQTDRQCLCNAKCSLIQKRGKGGFWRA